MHLVRYRSRSDLAAGVGVFDGSMVVALTGVPDMAALLGLPLSAIRERCRSAAGDAATWPVEEVELLVPADGRTEVWAAGVTYRRSMEARVEESVPAPDIYDLVYAASRPELFFKSAAWRTVVDGEPIAIRSDSSVNVPEPELALVLNRFAEIVGYTVCNDVSSRSIEGENPLYLPQAKVYLGSCALASVIRPSWEVADPGALEMSMAIVRGEAVVWQGTASTSELHRTLTDLVAALFLADEFPDGVVLSTGTSLVPGLDFTLQVDDRVRIDIAEIGRLENPVVRGKDAMAWLSTRQ